MYVLREGDLERMLEGKAMVEDTDMPVKMQLQAMASASQALDLYDVFDCRSIAAHIKKVLSLSLKYIENIIKKTVIFYGCGLQRDFK